MAGTGLTFRPDGERVRDATTAGAQPDTGTSGGNNINLAQIVDAPDLKAIEALAGTSGLLAKTAANTWALRTLAAPAAGLTITNPAGVAGNPTFALANDLSALEGLGSTGIACRTATDTWAQRSLAAPAAGLTISNPAGIAGNPTFALANDTAALEGLSGTGYARRTGVDTWTLDTSIPWASISSTPTTLAGYGITDAQGLDSDLTAIAGLSPSNDDVIQRKSGAWTNRTMAELLADLGYAVGTWTPVVTFGTPGDVSVAYTVQQGRYVRMGALVVAWLDIGFTPTYTTAAGNFAITGLPHTIENVMNIMGTFTQGANAVTLNAGATTASFVGVLNSTGIAVQDWGSATARANWTVTQITSGTGRRLTGMIVYRAA